MSDPLPTYSFLPWVRQGVANKIAGVPAAQRATIAVELKLSAPGKAGGTLSDTVTRAVELYGPGDVIGVDPAQISRIEPDHWVTNFEPNYLPLIEFYDEDFPWRYTPAAPDGRRLLPWLALVVLAEGEFVERTDTVGRPLPLVEVTADFTQVFAPPDEAWAWAHVHVNGALSDQVVDANEAVVAGKLATVIATAPDTACSRLISPRKLKPKTGYHAFLMPAFESGRLAGLGIDPAEPFAANGLTPTTSAWATYPVAANRPDAPLFPFYHRWFFRTAEQGDFESLVRLLKPRAADARVGRRDIDVAHPGPQLSGIAGPKGDGVLRLGGALRAPLIAGTAAATEADAFENWATPYPAPFQSELAAFVDLADDYATGGAGANNNPPLHEAVRGDPDPLVTPPLYGRWHALTERLLTDRDGDPVPHTANWVHDLNLDPRWRVSAGMGTAVVQKNQESYMEGAWDQIGAVLEANRRIRLAQAAMAAGGAIYVRDLTALAAAGDGGLLTFTAPVAGRVRSDGVTVRWRLRGSPLSTAMTSGAMRRAASPRGRLARGLGLSGADLRGPLIARVNADEITAAPPKHAPAGILTPDAVAGAGGGYAPTATSCALLLGLFALLVLTCVIYAVWYGGGLLALCLFLLLAMVLVLWWWLWSGGSAKGIGLAETDQTPGAIDLLPGFGGFTWVEVPNPLQPPVIPKGTPDGTDSAAGEAFKAALKDQYLLIDLSRQLGAAPTLVPIDLAAVTGDLLAGLDPALTVPRWTLSGITVPPRIRLQIGERFVEAMAYPEFDVPMYEPLAAAGHELFVPNLHLVKPDSITLLETNQKFIEAYMVGLNHEFARELLWREYPTDQRGSYFRQFWDVRKKLAQAADPDAAREALKDIKPLHLWSATSDLGDHDNREAGPAAEEELVLVIRGELLKKYPNAVISAQPARWRLKDGGTPDKTLERELDPTRPPIFPLYEARVAPDIYFFGFDLTVGAARGDHSVDDKPGWFFRMEEVPGDARFGFDISRQDAQINVWNDLSWPDVAPNAPDGAPIVVAAMLPQQLTEPTGDAIEKHEQWLQDKAVTMDATLSAAELAYVALQTPVLMAVHAAELLPLQEEG